MRTRWTEENWLKLMQVYLKKPAGVKPLYSRDIVNLALELHFSPQSLYRRMVSLRRLNTPQIERLWNTYAKNPNKLSREVELLRTMEGFNNAEAFYEGVEVNESFETDFRPIPGFPTLTPVMLVLVLDLYFRLTPNTMVPETPEVATLAKALGISDQLVAEVLDIFQQCDPYLRHKQPTESPLTAPCLAVWQRYGNGDPSDLASYATQLQEYYRQTWPNKH